MAEMLKRTPHVFTSLKKKLTRKKGEGKYMVFSGSEENYIRNGAFVVEESIALFHGRANPLRHFSVDDLNNMNVDPLTYHEGGQYRFYQGSSQRKIYMIVKPLTYCKVGHNLYQGYWEGKVVLVKKPSDGYADSYLFEQYLRETVVATQMATHNNVHKILGCCLETDFPILVYEWMPRENLYDRIFLDDENQSRSVLEWKDRLRIAWEISHAVAYLHDAFPRPIIHTDLKPWNVFLDQHDAAKLCDFSLSISIPEGEEFELVDPNKGTYDYMAPEYRMHGKVSKSTDVYSFGVLFLVLLTGEKPSCYSLTGEGNFRLIPRFGIKNDCVSEIVDPAIIRNGVTNIEVIQLRESEQLAIRCISQKEDCRPTMVEVATQLKNMITSSESIPITSNFQANCRPLKRMGRLHREQDESFGSFSKKGQHTCLDELFDSASAAKEI